MTFFELACYSSYSRNKDEMHWWHTSSMMALHANMQRDPKKNAKGYEAKDFHPYATDKIDPRKAKFVRGLTEEERELHAEWAQKLRMKNGTTGK